MTIKISIKKYAYNVETSLIKSLDIMGLVYYSEMEVIIVKYVGYHRTSTREQHLDRGVNEILTYCQNNEIRLYKNKVYTDQQTGKNFQRPRYQMLKEEILEPGDALIITEVDRLGRNKKDTLRELHYFQDHDIRIMVLELPTTCQDIDKLENGIAKMMMETINNMLIEIYAAMAQAEIEKKEKRQKEGIQAKRDRGEWDDYGRPRKFSPEMFAKHYKRVLDGELGPFELMRELGLAKSTFYRYKKNYENMKKKQEDEPYVYIPKKEAPFAAPKPGEISIYRQD